MEPREQVEVWSYNDLDLRHPLHLMACDPDGQPYYGDEITLIRPGNNEKLCVLRRPEDFKACPVDVHHCKHHSLVLVRWGPGGFDGYDLEEVLT